MATVVDSSVDICIRIKKEGWLLKQGQLNKSFKKRWCVLRSNQTMDYYDIPKPTKETMETKSNADSQSNHPNPNTNPKNTKNGQSLPVSKIYKGTVNLKDAKNVDCHNNQKHGFWYVI